MEPHSQHTVELPPLSSTLEAQLREMYGRLAYTHKTHEKMADAYVSKYRSVKGVEIVLSAVTSGSLLIALFGNSFIGTVVAAVFATVLSGVLLYFKEGALGECAQKHSEVAAKLWGLRERLLSLMIDMKDDLPPLDARERRDAVNLELEKVYAGAPRTNSAAYAAAQKALKISEELYFSPAELDRLLPKALRRTDS